MRAVSPPSLSLAAARRPVVFCLVPAPLVHLYLPLCEWFAFFPGVEVAMERRSGADRRQVVGLPPGGGLERRLAERRVPVDADAVADDAAFELELPRVAQRYSGRLRVVRRAVPADARTARADDAADVARLAAGDMGVLDDLWLRHHAQLRAEVMRPAGAGPRAHRLTEQVFMRAVGGLIAAPDTEVPRALHAAVAELVPA